MKSTVNKYLTAIREYCFWCSNNQPKEIKLCAVQERCALYPYRMYRTKDDLKVKQTERYVSMAIDKKCGDCRGGGSECTSDGKINEKCPLYDSICLIDTKYFLVAKG